MGKAAATTLVLCLLLSAPLAAQEMGPGADLSNPRATMATFLTGLNPPTGKEIDVLRAVRCMDLSALDSFTREDPTATRDLALSHPAGFRPLLEVGEKRERGDTYAAVFEIHPQALLQALDGLECK